MNSQTGVVPAYREGLLLSGIPPAKDARRPLLVAARIEFHDHCNFIEAIDQVMDPAEYLRRGKL
jgi:hypothetical protein